MQHGNLLATLDECADRLGRTTPATASGRVVGASGLTVDIAGLSSQISVGDWLLLRTRSGQSKPAEVVGFRDGRAQAMTTGRLDGLGPGDEAIVVTGRGTEGGRSALEARHPVDGGALRVADGWLGRTIDPAGAALDGAGPLPQGPLARPVRAAPPEAMRRARLGPRLDLGVAAMNLFTTCCRGQRLGLFAGSGVGKSTLMGMLARQSACDVIVVALVGERGREVREFLEHDLGPEGRARAVVVVATSDTAPLLRRQASYAAMTVAEHFRDQGKSVLLLLDSITRFCGALREIGLAAGEPPATRGFPPSMFAELPRLLERAGPGPEVPGQPTGHITALFTVLVEGDDTNEPVADAVRGFLDGHVLLDRRIAESGRFPAIDVLRSLSRAPASCNSAEDQAALRRARAILAVHADMADMVRLGAYRPGSDPVVDEAVLLAPRIDQVLRQDQREARGLEDSFAQLRSVLGGG